MEQCQTYYYISYQWKRNFSTWQIEDEVIDVHPIKWLVDIRDEYGVCVEGGERTVYDYTLLWWTEVSRDIYTDYDGCLS